MASTTRANFSMKDGVKHDKKIFTGSFQTTRIDSSTDQENAQREHQWWGEGQTRSTRARGGAACANEER